MSGALEFRGFALTHGGSNNQPLMADVSLEIARGGFYLLLGESGSGKSSLLRIICGLWEERELPPEIHGELRVLGMPVQSGYPAALRRKVVAVLQDEGLLDEISPLANVELSLRVSGRSVTLARELLSRVGLDDQLPDQVAMLSGGMRKRVAVARALAADPELVLFDEPTAGLDASAARRVAELLLDANRLGKDRTTIVITHDLDAFKGLADGMLVIDREQRSLTLQRPGEVKAPVRIAAAEKLPQPDPTLRGLQRFLLTVGSFSHTLLEAVLRLPPAFPGVVGRTTVWFVLESVLFVVLAGVTIGGLATFFALRNNPLEGAFVQQLLTGAGKVLVAVLIPLLAGFFFTARMAAGAAARIGTMKRTNQVAALEMIGVRCTDYLLTPLVWAMCLAMPIATAAGIVGGSLASLASARMVAGVTAYGWATGYFATVDKTDIRWILVKTTLSGFLVAVLTYHVAMAPKRSGRDVGESVNSCIVIGMVTVLVVHAGITLLAYD